MDGVWNHLWCFEFAKSILLWEEFIFFKFCLTKTTSFNDNFLVIKHSFVLVPFTNTIVGILIYVSYWLVMLWICVNSFLLSTILTKNSLSSSVRFLLCSQYFAKNGPAVGNFKAFLMDSPTKLKIVSKIRKSSLRIAQLVGSKFNID